VYNYAVSVAHNCTQLVFLSGTLHSVHIYKPKIIGYTIKESKYDFEQVAKVLGTINGIKSCAIDQKGGVVVIQDFSTIPASCGQMSTVDLVFIIAIT
jgi:hypothetical protein